jgi:4-amino-4-deoxy-L-arabinose transferase-like glycosyltransferase
MVVWWGLALIFKLVLVSITPLTSDENYYWVWSQNLSLSYYDHPPMVAWLFKLGDTLPEFMLKWPATLLGHASLLIWGGFLRNIGFNDSQVRLWFTLAVMAPLVGMATMILTPDLPLLFFFSVAVFSFERALTSRGVKAYAIFGLSLGLGFTSKYHIVLIAPCLIMYLATSGRWREIEWKNLTWVILFSLIGAAPVLIWNYQHDWASFLFQLDHGMGRKVWRPIWPLEYLGSLVFLLSPIYLRPFVRGIRDFKQPLLIYLGLPIFLFFLATSFRSKVEANWSQLAFLPTLSLLAFYDKTKWKSKFTLLVWTSLLGVLLYSWGRTWYPGCPDKLCEPRRYEVVMDIAKDYQPFLASNYQMASYLWFQTKKPHYKLYDMSRTDYFDHFPEAVPQASTFYLVKHLETLLPQWIQEKNYNFEVVKRVDDELELLRIFK